VKTRCKSNTTGKSSKKGSIFTCDIIKIGSIAINPNEKFRKFAHVEEMGMISRGIENCLSICPLLIIEEVASEREFAQNIQGRIAERTKRGYRGRSEPITLVNTKLIAAMIRSGVITAQERPRIEPTYLARKSLRTIILKVPQWW
jgi:hypothetical protein